MLFFRDENEENGFVIDTDEVGLRLKAFEYWKCSETGLTTDTAVPNTIKFVLAESLPGQGTTNMALLWISSLDVQVIVLVSLCASSNGWAFVMK